ncbi:hypothetical protein TNCV_1269671 [Trichonephila clavipes]|nr:hypothetical protein TNCV_1269671 [Trichonephila clavipes]
MGSLVVRASDSRPEGLGSMSDATKCTRSGVAIYRPFGEFHPANSHCHLYGDESQRQAYFQLFATLNFVDLDLTSSDRWHEQQQL